MAKRRQNITTEHVNDDPLSPAESQADWIAQGWAETPEPLTAAPRLAFAVSAPVDPESARLPRRAARLRGLTRSAFVRAAAIREADRVNAESCLPASMRLNGQPAIETFVQGCGVPESTTQPTSVTKGGPLVIEISSQ